MRANIIPMGNFQEMRILDQVCIGNEAELIVDQDNVIIRQAERPREGWGENFRDMADSGEDRMLDDAAGTKWDEDEWE